ncbi:hypothetical protein [Paracoccus beibuensis]|uniref:hypothetical protein n=1 Tax=Paracoccus beibuensis TaxID=547602 RepID=UPI00223FD4EE|nr:hypothetical protein [Paracoccus beibuensis]
MITTALRVLKLTPWLALAGVAWLFLDMRSDLRSQDRELVRLEQELTNAAAQIQTVKDEADAAIERQVQAIAAVEAELERQTEMQVRYRDARESLAGLDDGEVAPVLGAALEALR